MASQCKLVSGSGLTEISAAPWAHVAWEGLYILLISTSGMRRTTHEYVFLTVTEESNRRSTRTVTGFGWQSTRIRIVIYLSLFKTLRRRLARGPSGRSVCACRLSDSKWDGETFHRSDRDLQTVLVMSVR